MSSAAPTRYDEVPYEAKPFPETHPDRLATLAALFGRQPPAVERCRLLELGCADGANLIPLALTLPGASFLGIDLSSRQIAAGRKAVAELGLTNVELRTASILDVGADYGSFDYIVCHGVYSWVPPNVQEKILDVCRDNLAPNGVAYVSYNTYPGWYQGRMIRELMQFHARRFPDPLEQAKQARAYLEFITRSLDATIRSPTDQASPYLLILKGAVEAMGKKSDSYLLHEYLEEVNEPLYFYQFVDRAAKHGLQYLGDARIQTMTGGRFPPDVQDGVRRLSTDLIQMEQHLDFLQNRPFRRTLLCHQGGTVDHALRPEALARFLVAGLVRPESAKPDILSNVAEQFRLPDGQAIISQEPLVKAALVHLFEVAPQAVPFEALVDAARAARGAPADPAARRQDALNLGARLLNFLASGLIELHLFMPKFVTTVSERPLASPLARWQALKGPRVTNMRLEQVDLNEPTRHLLGVLDGTKNFDRLLEFLADLLARGVLKMEKDGQRVTDPRQVRDLLRPELHQVLTMLARSACLIG